MSIHHKITSDVQNAWAKLHAHWQGAAAETFYGKYVVKLTEISEAYEAQCSQLASSASELMNELEAIERNISGS